MRRIGTELSHLPVTKLWRIGIECKVQQIWEVFYQCEEYSCMLYEILRAFFFHRVSDIGTKYVYWYKISHVLRGNGTNSSQCEIYEVFAVHQCPLSVCHDTTQTQGEGHSWRSWYIVMNSMSCSISILPLEGFSLNFGHMLISMRRCVEPMPQLYRLKVKVTFKEGVTSFS